MPSFMLTLQRHGRFIVTSECAQATKDLPHRVYTDLTSNRLDDKTEGARL